MQRPMLIASDVDGTLLDATEQVTERTRAVITKVLAAGVPFVLASGRPPRWTTWLAEQAGGLDGFAVCCNGSVRYHFGTDTVLAAVELDPVLLRDVTRAMAEELPGVAFAAERVGRSANDPDITPFVTDPGYLHPWQGDRSVVASRAEVIGHPCVKLLARAPSMTSDEMAVITRALAGDRIDVTFSTSAGLIELAAAGVTKASGLAAVATELGVPAERVVAFGDMPNDLEMLRWAGHGVAMANAHPTVRAVADEITGPHTEDGVAQVLERWF